MSVGLLTRRLSLDHLTELLPILFQKDFLNDDNGYNLKKKLFLWFIKTVKSTIKIYRVSQLFPAILQGLMYDVNWNNFYPKHFSCLRRFKKLQKIENIDIFEKTNSGFFLFGKKFYTHQKGVKRSILCKKFH